MKHHFGEKMYHLFLPVYKFTFILELLVACIVIVGTGIRLLGLPTVLLQLYENGASSDFLQYVFNIIIGTELIKMLVRHDLDSVVEVLLFTVARYMIIEHHSMVDTLIGVVSIAVLFLIRKYLFVSALDEDVEEDKPPVKGVNSKIQKEINNLPK